MVRQEVWMDVKLMHRQGHSVRHIARVTGLSRVTVRRILSSPTPKHYGPRPSRPCKLDPFVPRLEAVARRAPACDGELAASHAVGRGLRWRLRDREGVGTGSP